MKYKDFIELFPNEQRICILSNTTGEVLKEGEAVKVRQNMNAEVIRAYAASNNTLRIWIE